MATTASRMSLDPQPSLIDLPLANPLPNPHVRLPDPASAVHPQTRRVSSESQAPGRASPSPKISRRTPVPFLLEAFPAPPSHIPGTPSSLSPSTILSPSLLGSATSWSSASGGSAVPTNPPSSSNALSPCSPKSVPATLSHNNPPPSSPPSAPLPPVPGPSSVSATHRTLQTVVRSGSPALSMSEPRRSLSRAEQRPRPSIGDGESARGRGRQGSLSSLRNPIHPMGEQGKAILEETVVVSSSSPPLALVSPHSPPLFGSVAARRSHDQSRGDSPDILRSCISRATATPLLPPGDKPCAEDSLASVDMSDLSALKSDNEGDGDDPASHPFPRFPPHSRSQPQSPSDPQCSDPLYVHSPQKRSVSSVFSLHVSSTSEDMTSRDGALSPEIRQMISATPRPRKRSTPSRSRESSSTRNRKESAKSGRGVDVPPVPASSQMVKSMARSAEWLSRDDGHESDSSLDLHTPLPQLMLQHGMLSPNSKLLPRTDEDRRRLSVMSSSSLLSNASNLSLKSIASTCSKHAKDARDTPQRRVRHRDGKLLKGGIGLTTGLGWSDSEDEDAPSALTRRVSTLVLARRASSASVGSCRSVRSQPIARSISHSILREADEFDDENGADEFGHSNHSSLATRSLPSRTKSVSRVGSVRSTGSSLGRYSTYSTSSAGIRTRAGSVSESSIYSDGYTGLMPGIREHDDGVTPTRAAFERSSLSSNGGSGADVPHTPSSTASSTSLPFPATPESCEGITQPRIAYDKTLPPLPPGAKAKHPSVGPRPQIGGLQRPRVSSNASSLSNHSILGPPSTDGKSNTPSATSTPRQSLADRPAKPTIQTASQRPSLSGTQRPSLTIPKSPFPSQSQTSGLPRPTTPSLLPSANAGGYAPRPLRLVSRSSPLTSPTLPANANVSPYPPPNQAELNPSPSKVLQPGEQVPRPGQVLMYNRNVHDQLKLRALSPSTAPDRASGPAVSPGGTQTLFIPSPAVASSPNSAVSTPVATRSQSPLPSPSPSGESFRPKPRTGTGMVYRNNLSVGSVTTSRIRVPSTVSR